MRYFVLNLNLIVLKTNDYLCFKFTMLNVVIDSLINNVTCVENN